MDLIVLSMLALVIGLIAALCSAIPAVIYMREKRQGLYASRYKEGESLHREVHSLSKSVKTIFKILEDIQSKKSVEEPLEKDLELSTDKIGGYLSPWESRKPKYLQ